MKGFRGSSLFTSQEMSNFLKRGKKTSRDQVEMYVHFLEKNPTVAMARSNPTNDSTINSLWEELTFQLNASEQGPYKSMQQWQETFANWRYQLRFKTRKLIERQESGLDILELSQLEERALKVFTSGELTDSATRDDQYILDTIPFVDTALNGIPRRKFTRKRTRSSTPSLERRISRASVSVDSTSQFCETPLDCEATTFYDYFGHEQKPQIIQQQQIAIPLLTETSSQTDQEFNEIGGKRPTESNETNQVAAINSLEKAVNSLNETLKTLVQVQTDMVSAMNNR